MLTCRDLLRKTESAGAYHTETVRRRPDDHRDPDHGTVCTIDQRCEIAGSLGVLGDK